MKAIVPITLPFGLTLLLGVEYRADEAVAILRQPEERLRSPKPLFDRLGGIARDRYFHNFSVGGDPKWAPLKPRTVAAKRRTLRRIWGHRARPIRLRQGGKALGPHTILVVRGDLRDSYVQKGAPGHVEELSELGGKPTLLVGSKFTIRRKLAARKPLRPYMGITRRSLRARMRGSSVGVEIPLAAIHDRGAPAAHIPARPQFADGKVKDEDLSQVRRAAADHYLGRQT